MTPSIRSYSRTSWFLKCCVCLLAGIAIVNTLELLLAFVPPWFWEKYPAVVEYFLLGTVGLAVLGGVGYSLYWHQRERVGQIDSRVRYAWLLGLIRYWLALSIASYGFAKILKTQFDTPDYRRDMVMGDANGFHLTWYYFGYSYPLAVIIALFQIGGSVLLLYRRTTLLGVMLLLPVLVNIVLINLFFSISTGAFFNSVIFTLGLLLLLVLDWPKLKVAFWDLVEHLPPITLGRNWMKHGLRVLPIAAAFAFIAYLLQTNKSDTLLKGTWQVDTLTRNGQVVPADAWLTDTAAWTRVYFAGWQGVVFSPNPYRYKQAESWRGTYAFDSTKQVVQLVMPARKDRKDTIQATISRRTATSMQLNGVFGRDTVRMQLTRLR